MKKITKITAFMLSVVLLAGLLAGCGGGDKVKNDVPVAELAALVDPAIGADGNLSEAPATYIQGMMGMDVSAYEEYVVKINAYGTNIDEYGIFKGSDEAQAKEIADAVEAYLQMRNDTWMTEYMPEEYPKMEAAEFKTVGCYVMYAILSDDAKAAGFAAFEDALKG